MFKFVTPRYASYWKEIGIFLDFKPGQLEIIKMDNPADTKRSCNDMFIKWLQTDSSASWEKFFNALDLAVGAVTTSSVSALVSKSKCVTIEMHAVIIIAIS